MQEREEDRLQIMVVAALGPVYANNQFRLLESNDTLYYSKAGVYTPIGAAPGVPLAHAASHQDGGTDEIVVTGLSGLLADPQKVNVRKNSTGSVFQQKQLNFIEGSAVTLTVADDGGTGEVDITIAATATAPALPFNSVQYNNAGNFGGDAGFTWNNPGSATQKLVVMGFTAQSGNLQEWHRPDTTIGSALDPWGNLVSPLSFTGTGTLTTSGSNTVTGTGTLFTEQVRSGDVIVASGQSRTVLMVTNNTSLQVDVIHSPFLAAATFVIHRPAVRLIATGTVPNRATWTDSSGVLAGVISAANQLKLIGTGSKVSLTASGGLGRSYDFEFDDPAGLMRFGRSDVVNKFQLGSGTTSATIGASVSAVDFNINIGGGTIILTPTNAGGAGKIQLGRRLSDSHTAVGAQVECWPATGQTTPVFSCVVPGGATKTFQIMVDGRIQAPSASLKAATLRADASQTANILDIENSSAAILALVNKDGGFVFNEQGLDTDCRIEGDTEVNLFFTDASTERVGVGLATPDTRLHVKETKTLAASPADDYAGAATLEPLYTGAFTVTRHNYIDAKDVALAGSAVVTDACLVRFNAAAGTHKAVDAGTTKTTPGTVDAWIKVNVAGTVYYSPLYLSKTS